MQRCGVSHTQGDPERPIAVTHRDLALLHYGPWNRPFVHRAAFLIGRWRQGETKLRFVAEQNRKYC